MNFNTKLESDAHKFFKVS